MRSAAYRFRTSSGGPAGTPKPGFFASCLALIVGLAAAVLALGLAAFVFVAGLVVIAFLYIRRLLTGGGVAATPTAGTRTDVPEPEVSGESNTGPEDQAELEQFHGNLDEWFAQKRKGSS